MSKTARADVSTSIAGVRAMDASDSDHSSAGEFSQSTRVHELTGFSIWIEEHEDLTVRKLFDPSVELLSPAQLTEINAFIDENADVDTRTNLSPNMHGQVQSPPHDSGGTNVWVEGDEQLPGG